jgi:SAM-dependent methyltransferase
VNWAYTESDPALRLFTAAKARFGFDCPEDAAILELGCAETDFLERLQAQNPCYRLTGVDCYPQPRANVMAGDACDRALFPMEHFDAILLLGALEHFGLGFYGDPVHNDRWGAPNGDIRAMCNVARWLKPGGWVYFDVPVNPVGGIKENRHFRIFSPQDVTDRLLVTSGLQEVARAYSWPEPQAHTNGHGPGDWCEVPTKSLVPYWFVAVHARKVA